MPAFVIWQEQLYIGHNYIRRNSLLELNRVLYQNWGHNYIGHNYTGRNYTDHDHMGHNYIGHNYKRRNSLLELNRVSYQNWGHLQNDGAGFHVPISGQSSTFRYVNTYYVINSAL